MKLRLKNGYIRRMWSIRKSNKSRSASRTLNKDGIIYYEIKDTPKDNIKDSYLYRSTEEEIRNPRFNRMVSKNSPKLISSRVSRSNSSKNRNISSKKTTSKEPKVRPKRNEGSRNSSRRVLGFESEESKESQNVGASNDCIFNKYDKQMKPKEKLVKIKPKSRSPRERTRTNTRKTRRKKKKQAKQVRIICESEDEGMLEKMYDNGSHSKPPLPKTPNSNKHG